MWTALFLWSRITKFALFKDGMVRRNSKIKINSVAIIDFEVFQEKGSNSAVFSIYLSVQALQSGDKRFYITRRRYDFHLPVDPPWDSDATIPRYVEDGVFMLIGDVIWWKLWPENKSGIPKRIQYEFCFVWLSTSLASPIDAKMYQRNRKIQGDPRLPPCSGPPSARLSVNLTRVGWNISS